MYFYYTFFYLEITIKDKEKSDGKFLAKLF